MRKTHKSKLDRALDTLVRIQPRIQRAITRNAKLSNRYTAEQCRAFAEGDEAGKRLARKLFDFR